MNLENRYIVAKIEDCKKYLSLTEHSMLAMLLNKVRNGRLNNKQTDNKYIVVNSRWKR